MSDQRKASDEEITQAITRGITFRPARSAKRPDEGQGKIKTKAKKKKFVTGTHGSGSARKKAEIRERRANRHK